MKTKGVALGGLLAAASCVAGAAGFAFPPGFHLGQHADSKPSTSPLWPAQNSWLSPPLAVANSPEDGFDPLHIAGPAEEEMVPLQVIATAVAIAMMLAGYVVNEQSFASLAVLHDWIEFAHYDPVMIQQVSDWLAHHPTLLMGM